MDEIRVKIKVVGKRSRSFLKKPAIGKGSGWRWKGDL